MSKGQKTNWLLLGGVALLVAWPLLFVKGDFEGADAQAGELVKELSPDYTPWAEPVFEPASSEIESLLFALQAALGAGTIGFIFGGYHERRRQQRQTSTSTTSKEPLP
ncbi:energy-coupling factor ABC transporter substrate-binding protein [uncultured Thermosynechococcus sp.]|uniref:energy-coupling factor ABC transporter substrate-binding protein n=1 Tax=uncultured Thermosynechococcus sp. TaxID=436945 RepID=UPI00260C7006|nr:energy-coupling factor ABC transporter substrate-binding protein [uncultured Thermosynechococcus sp.]